MAASDSCENLMSSCRQRAWRTVDAQERALPAPALGARPVPYTLMLTPRDSVQNPAPIM